MELPRQHSTPPRGRRLAPLLKHSESVSGLRGISLERLKERHVIKLPDTTDLLRWGRPRLEPGRGHEHEFDFAQMELELSFDMISGKRHIVLKDSDNFVYQFESFLQDGSLFVLTSLNERVPQEEINQAYASAIERDDILRSHAREILSSLESLLYWCAKVGGQPEEPLERFCKKWCASEAKRIPFERRVLQVCNALCVCPSFEQSPGLQVSSRQVMQLRHLESLYETFEGMVSYFALQGVDSAFKNCTPNHNEQQQGTRQLSASRQSIQTMTPRTSNIVCSGSLLPGARRVRYIRRRSAPFHIQIPCVFGMV
jgi:hypothetical protein